MSLPLKLFAININLQNLILFRSDSLHETDGKMPVTFEVTGILSLAVNQIKEENVRKD